MLCSAVGIWLSVIGISGSCQLSASAVGITYSAVGIGYQLSAISYQLSAVGCRLSAISCRLSAVSVGGRHHLSAVGIGIKCQLRNVTCQPSAIG